MELLAVIRGLEALKVEGLPITIFSDSKYVVDSVQKGWIWSWQKKGFKGKKNMDLWKKYIPLHLKYKPTFQWVKGHAGNPLNERCDELAVSDAFVLGSLAKANSPASILDIGTGTGVLALMMAQKYPVASIDAVEIDKEAFEQARQNVSFNKLGINIKVHQQAFQEFEPGNIEQYDLIITNPPYYSRHLQSSKQNINLARHEQGLNFTDLWTGIDRLLKTEGMLWLILPPKEMEAFKSLGTKKGFYANTQTLLQDRETSKVHRVIASFVRIKPEQPKKSVLVIKDANNAYTPEYIGLLKNYMLHF